MHWFWRMTIGLVAVGMTVFVLGWVLGGSSLDVAWLLGVVLSWSCVFFLIILVFHQRGRKRLTFGVVRWWCAVLIILLSGLGGVVAALVGPWCFYELIVPCLSGYNQDRDRAIMYWLHRYALSPLGLQLGQSGWETGMRLLTKLPVALAVPCCAAGIVLGEVLLRRVAWPVPADWLPHCPCCLYDLTGNTSGICPECGDRATSVTDSVTASDCTGKVDKCIGSGDR